MSIGRFLVPSGIVYKKKVRTNTLAAQILSQVKFTGYYSKQTTPPALLGPDDMHYSFIDGTKCRLPHTPSVCNSLVFFF
jgi:hypothetical protein